MSFYKWFTEKPKFEFKNEKTYLMIELPSASWICATLLLISLCNIIFYL